MRHRFLGGKEMKEMERAVPKTKVLLITVDIIITDLDVMIDQKLRSINENKKTITKK